MEKSLWIARDKDGLLFTFTEKPMKDEKGWFLSQGRSYGIRFMPDIFPELTSENSPQQVELKLKEG